MRRLMGSVIRELGQHVPLGTLSPSAPTVRVQTPEPETSDESILMLGNARAEMARGSREGYRHAIELLERAVVDSPALALTSSKLAEARLGQALAGFVPTPDVKEKAISEASMAEAQDSSVEVRLIRERVRAFFEWRWDEALDAISELGDSADVAITRAELLVARSESDLAVVEAKRAAALEPLSPSIGERAARVLYLAGRWVDAQEHAHAALIQSDSAIPAKVVLALSLTQQRMYESAHEELLALLRESIDQPDADVALGQLYGLWRKRAGAVKILRRLDHPPRPRFVPQTMIAKIESALGETNAALDRLEAALEAREVHLAFLRADPAWAPIRGHERFRMLEQTVFTPAP